MNHYPSRPGHIALSKLIGAMLDNPQSIRDLTAESGLNLTTVKHYVRTFRRQGVAHIAEWQLDGRGRMTVPAYALGKGRDAVRKVTPIDNAARMRRLRARQRDNRVLHALAA